MRAGGTSVKRQQISQASLIVLVSSSSFSFFAPLFSHLHHTTPHTGAMKPDEPLQEATAVLLEFLEVAVHQVL
jgi:hypothetical protein